MFCRQDLIKLTGQLTYAGVLGVLTYLLAHSLHSTLSGEAVWFSESQEIPCILWNPQVHYHLYQCLPPVPILTPINPVHVLHPSFWRSILILSAHLHLDLPSGLSPSGFPNKTPVCTSPLPHMCYMLCSSHSSWFDHPYIWWGVEISKLLTL